MHDGNLRYLLNGRSPLAEVLFGLISSLAATTPNSNAIESEDKMESQMLRIQFLLAVHVVDDSSYALTL